MIYELFFSWGLGQELQILSSLWGHFVGYGWTTQIILFFRIWICNQIQHYSVYWHCFWCIYVYCWL